MKIHLNFNSKQLARAYNIIESLNAANREGNSFRNIRYMYNKTMDCCLIVAYEEFGHDADGVYQSSVYKCIDKDANVQDCGVGLDRSQFLTLLGQMVEIELRGGKFQIKFDEE